MTSEVISGSEAYILRLQQQKAALAEFGVEAFRTDDLDALLTNAAALAGEGLGVDRAKVLEVLPSGDQLLVRAGVGWEKDVVGKATIDADVGSPAGYALRTGTPVVSDDLEADARFHCPELLRRHAIKSAINVIISGNDGPFGVLEVDSQHMRHFTEDDVNFLQATPICWRRRSTASGRTACWSKQRTRRQCCCTSSNTGSRTVSRSSPA